MLEEYYKILRSGHAEQAMRQLRATKLMKEITPELSVAPDALWRSIAALDRYRARFQSAPDSLTNAILAGTLLQPLGLATRQRGSPPTRSNGGSKSGCCRLPGATSIGCSTYSMQARLLDLNAPARAQRNLLHRSSLEEALTWLEIHGDRPDVVAHWRNLQAQGAPAPASSRARRRLIRSGPGVVAAGAAARRSSRRRNSESVSIPGFATKRSPPRAPSTGAAASRNPPRCSAAAGR